jgi:hypothetical protein
VSKKNPNGILLSCTAAIPRQERWEIARWLREDLQECNLSDAESKGSSDNGGQIPPLPDYSARRRRIFGSKVLPNMVLAGPEEWL